MRNRAITIPRPVRQKVAILGTEGMKWLADLDDLVEELEQEWQITVGSILEGGTEAYVAQARTRDGAKVILKVAIPESNGNTGLAHEVTALTVADGHGYARILRSDLSRRALLLESLGIPLKNLGYSTTAQIDIICTTLKESWVRISPESPLPSGAIAAQWLSKFISDLWENLGRPCSQQALDMALAFAQARGKGLQPRNRRFGSWGRSQWKHAPESLPERSVFTFIQVH